MPIVLSSRGARIPKYFNAIAAQPPILFPDAIFAVEDYGNEPLMLLCSDMSDPDDALLAAQSDVTKFADDIDTPVGAANLATLQQTLNNLKLPGNMVTANTQYRKVIRGILGIFAIGQCMLGKNQPIIGVGITLQNTLASLPGDQELALMACAVDHGYDMSSITMASTVRQFLVAIANQASPISLLDIIV